MLDVVNKGSNSQGEDWFDVWKQSQESKGVQTEIDRIHKERQGAAATDGGSVNLSEFAMPFWFQLWQVTYRVFQQYWRMPSYIMSKWALGIAAGLFIGFSFYDAKTSLQGMQTIIYSVFMLCTIFTSLVQQVRYSCSQHIYIKHLLTYSPVDAPLRDPAISLRGPRATQQGILLESLLNRQRHR